MDVLRVEKDKDAQALYWLQLATDKSAHGDRQVLSGINVKDENAEACDGYRYHSTPKPDALEEATGKVVILNDGKKMYKSTGRLYATEEVEGVYPDMDKCHPEHHQQPVVKINVLAKYLKEALEMPAKKVTITVYDSTQPLLVESKDGEYQALIMPRHEAMGDNRVIDKRNERLRGLAELIAEMGMDCIDNYEWRSVVAKAREALDLPIEQK